MDAVRAQSVSSGNARAVAAAVVGLRAAATMPLALLAPRYYPSVELLHAGYAIPLALVLGCAAIVLSRRARQHDDLRLGRAGGRGTARLGWALAVLGIALAATCLVALAVYGLLTYLGER